jgi:hypothetical protein
LTFLKNTGNLNPTPTTDETPPTPDVLEENKSSNAISSMLYIWKYLNNSTPRGKDIWIGTSEPKYFNVGSFLVPTQEGYVSSEVASETVNVEFVIKYVTKEERQAEIDRNQETVQRVEENTGYRIDSKF